MSNPIKIVLKRGQTAGGAPSSLAFGELAVNTFDGTFFVGANDGGIVDFPQKQNYIYNTHADFLAVATSGVLELPGCENALHIGDRLLIRDTLTSYVYLGAQTGSTGCVCGSCTSGAIGSWVELPPSNSTVSVGLTATVYFPTTATTGDSFVRPTAAGVPGYQWLWNGFGWKYDTVVVTSSVEGLAPSANDEFITPNIFMQDSVPSAGVSYDGYLWFNTSTGVSYVFVEGASGDYWVQFATLNNEI